MMRTLCGAAVVFAALAAGSAWAVQDAPKKAYVVVQIDVTNPQQYAEYMKLSPGIITKFGGRFIARGGRGTCGRKASGSRTERECAIPAKQVP